MIKNIKKVLKRREIYVVIFENVMYLKYKDNMTKLDLSKYGFDYSKPVKPVTNHLYQDEFLKKLINVIQENLFDRKSLFKASFNVCIGIAEKTDKVELRHFFDVFNTALGVKISIHFLPKKDGEIPVTYLNRLKIELCPENLIAFVNPGYNNYKYNDKFIIKN